MCQNYTYVCVPCRNVNKGPATVCAFCGNDMRCMGARWAAPKRNNKRAWGRIENGELLWDRRKVTKKLQGRGLGQATRRPNQKKGSNARPLWGSCYPKPIMPGR